MQAGAACRGGLGPAAAFMQSAHSGSLRKPEPAGGRISSGNAYYVFLLYDRKIHQLHCNSRNFLRRRGYKIWLAVRFDNDVGNHCSGGHHSGICAETAGVGGILSAQPG